MNDKDFKIELKKIKKCAEELKEFGDAKKYSVGTFYCAIILITSAMLKFSPDLDRISKDLIKNHFNSEVEFIEGD